MLRERSIIPDLIVTSDAVRARTTAEAVAQSAGYTGELIVEPSLYHASPDEVIVVLNAVPDAARSVMIVGHNPGLASLITQLTNEYHDLPTAAFVQIDLPIDRWSQLDLSSSATVVDTWQPKERPE